MTRNLNLVYVSAHCYNGRARMDFGVDRRDGSVKVRRVSGSTTRFSNIAGDINARLSRGRGSVRIFPQGWIYFPNKIRRRA